MVDAFVNSKIRHDKVTLFVIFVKGTCPYCRNAVALMQKFNFLPGHLEVVDIT
ncbi:Glutaredoxin-1, partial [Anas platyrhynchos]